MAKTPERPSLFERLKTGLEEGIQFARGELNLRTTELPDRPPAVSAKRVVQLRKRLGMSQGVFARMLNVSSKTVQSWEQGERQPSSAALRLLQILDARPRMVYRIVGLGRTTGTKKKKAAP